jgi:hypothetical protein
MKLFSVRGVFIALAACAFYFVYLFSIEESLTLTKSDAPHIDAFMTPNAPVSIKPAKAFGYCVPCGGPKSDGDIDANILSHGPTDTHEFELTGRLATYALSPSGSTECFIRLEWPTRGKFILLLGAAPTRLSGEIITDGDQTRFIFDKKPSKLNANIDGRIPVLTAIWESAAIETLAKTATEVDLLRGALPRSIKKDDVIYGFSALFCSPAKVLFSPVSSENRHGSYDDLTIRVTSEGRAVSWERINTNMTEVERRFRIIAWLD